MQKDKTKMCIYRTACHLCQIHEREFPAQPQWSVRTQSNSCLDVHFLLLVQHGQPFSAWWFPSAMDVHVHFSTASNSSHLPSSSASIGGGLGPQRSLIWPILLGYGGFLGTLFHHHIWNQMSFCSLFFFSHLAEAEFKKQNHELNYPPKEIC